MGEELKGDDDSGVTDGSLPDGARPVGDAAVEAVVDQAGQEDTPLESGDSPPTSPLSESELAQQQGVDISERVEDYDEAEDMALAGDLERSRAARLRSVADKIESGENVDPNIVDQDKYLQTMDRSERKFKEHLISDSAWGNAGNTPDILRRHADSEDQDAIKKENWARTLRKYPISEAYKDSHPEDEFTPAGLADLDNTLQEWDQAIASTEMSVRELNGADIFYSGAEISGGPDGYYGKMNVRSLIDAAALRTAMQGEGTRAELEERRSALESQLNELKKNPETTLGQLRDFYSGLVEAVYLKPWHDQANIIRVVLDDIKSGRASEPTPPQPEAQAA